MKGYKVFNPDWTCRGYQYEVGKTYEIEGELKICNNGFHFCTKAADCFNYYNFNSNNKVAEVEAIGNIEKDNEDSKCATSKILILRELSWHEVLELVNVGKDNTGLCNTGDCNTGDWNTGDCNTGDWNTGNRNTGDCNTGDWNTGDCNTGDWNTGDWNSGDFNSCNYSSGVFCTETPKLLMFDKLTEITLEDWRNSEPAWILRKLTLTEWIYEDDMTEEEKINNDSYKTTGGYLKKYSYQEAWRILWNKLNEEEKDILQRMPNFDKNKFKIITGIDLKEGE